MERVPKSQKIEKLWLKSVSSQPAEDWVNKMDQFKSEAQDSIPDALSRQISYAERSEYLHQSCDNW